MEEEFAAQKASVLADLLRERAQAEAAASAREEQLRAQLAEAATARTAALQDAQAAAASAQERAVRAEASAAAAQAEAAEGRRLMQELAAHSLSLEMAASPSTSTLSFMSPAKEDAAEMSPEGERAARLRAQAAAAAADATALGQLLAAQAALLDATSSAGIPDAVSDVSHLSPQERAARREAFLAAAMLLTPDASPAPSVGPPASQTAKEGLTASATRRAIAAVLREAEAAVAAGSKQLASAFAAVASPAAPQVLNASASSATLSFRTAGASSVRTPASAEQAFALAVNGTPSTSSALGSSELAAEAAAAAADATAVSAAAAEAGEGEDAYELLGASDFSLDGDNLMREAEQPHLFTLSPVRCSVLDNGAGCDKENEQACFAAAGLAAAAARSPLGRRQQAAASAAPVSAAQKQQLGSAVDG